MSLLASGSVISIQNSDGTTKFTSDNKLVYKSFVWTGSASVGGGNPISATFFPGITYQAKDVPILYVTITSGTGNVVSTVLNSTIQLGFPFLMHFDHSTTAVKITAWDVLTGALLPANSATGEPVRLQFSAVSLLSGGMIGVEKYVASSTPVSFDWRLVVLSYI